MPTISRPDGAVIHYDVLEASGTPFPVLLLAPGGVDSAIERWRRAPFDPQSELAGEFRLIAMDQRHAGGSTAPAAPFSYEQAAGDQLAVLDAASVERAHLVAGGIGCAFAWRLLQDAPERIAAAVCLRPVGLEKPDSLARFLRTFDESMRMVRAEGVEGVIRAAEANPDFNQNPGAGPFARRLHADPAFREEVRGLTVESYAALMVRFRDGIWPAQPPYFSVPAEWPSRCAAPLLLLPGDDELHPASVARRVCAEAPNASCLAAGWQEPARLPATVAAIKEFLREHTPARPSR